MQPKSVDRVEAGIQIIWQDGHKSIYSSEELRRLCPCAVCKEDSERVEGMIPRHHLPPAKIEIRSAYPVGWYALQFQFSDGHDTGIYSYEMLREKCGCEECS